MHPTLTAAATLVLSGADVKRLATAADLMASADSAFRELSAGDARVPARLKLDLGAGKRAIVMLGHLSRSRTLATKFVTVFADNAARGLPRILGVVVLNDPDTGGPLAIIDAASVTGLRTAAGSAVATRALARSGWSMLAVIGTGVQARAHLELFAQAFPLREVRVCGRRVEAAQELARDAASWTTASVHAAADVESAVRGAQVVVTATTAVAPLVKSEWLGAGCHVCAVGAASPTIREIGSDVIERAAVVAVDTREGALSEAGEAVLAIAERRLSADRLAEMGEILLGRRRGRQKEDELTLYKSVGTAALDAAAASALYLRAREQGVGTEVFLMAGE